LPVEHRAAHDASTTRRPRETFRDAFVVLTDVKLKRPALTEAGTSAASNAQN
jgi:hypothetical protein